MKKILLFCLAIILYSIDNISFSQVTQQVSSVIYSHPANDYKNAYQTILQKLDLSNYLHENKDSTYVKNNLKSTHIISGNYVDSSYKKNPIKK